MKTNINMSVDVETFKVARDIIQNEMGLTISGFVNDMFKNLVKAKNNKK